MWKARTLKNPEQEARIFTRRIIVSVIIICSLALLLVARVGWLQLVRHDFYSTMSEKNRLQLQPLGPTRGLIFDHNGVVLADNQPSSNLVVVLERVPDLVELLDAIGEIIPLSEEEVSNFHQRSRQRQRPFEPVPLKYHLTEEEIARLAVDRYRLPGVGVRAQLNRHYPEGEVTAHAIGYVGRISERDLADIDEKNYAATDVIGKLGVEKFYESILHGRVGYQQVETNARGRILRVVEKESPGPGKGLTLYLDIKLQRLATEVLEGKRGAVVAIDVKTGGVLALASTPVYDPNLFVTGISRGAYAALRNDPDIPLYNRALRGQYPPGSTIKPFLALAGLDTDTITPHLEIHDPGWYKLSSRGRFFRDWKREGHGKVRLYDAIVQSCDTYFYHFSHQMDAQVMADFLARFGFGAEPAADLGEALSGILPSPRWKSESRGELWYPGDNLNFGIGQGYMLATPLQLAVATAVLAGKGKPVTPKMVKAVGQSIDFDLPSGGRQPSQVEPIRLQQPGDWALIHQAMAGVMHDKKGTARISAQGANYEYAGKTGTAQVVKIRQGERYDPTALDERHWDHGLFVGFAPLHDPQIAVAVIVENGGSGSTAAAPVARRIFDAYLGHDLMPVAGDERADP